MINRVILFVGLCMAGYVLGEFIKHTLPGIQEGMWWVIHHTLFG